MKTSEILKAGKALIIDPKNWTQGAYFRNAEGAVIIRLSTEIIPIGVACMCSYGALRVVNNKPNDFGLIGEDYLRIAVNSIDNNTRAVDIYNDHHTHSEVMELWDKATQLAEEDEKK